jgi:hypothetical protein
MPLSTDTQNTTESYFRATSILEDYTPQHKFKHFVRDDGSHTGPHATGMKQGYEFESKLRIGGWLVSSY